MHRIRWISWALACTFCTSLGAAPPPVEAYGRLPAIQTAAISPDGKRVVISVGFEYSSAEPDRELTALRIVNIDTGAIEHTLPSPRANTLRGVGWADDTRAYYFISATVNVKDLAPSSWPVMFRGSRVEIFRTGVFSIETKAATMLMNSSDFRFNSSLTGLQAPIDGDPAYARVVTWGGGSTMMNANPRLCVYRVSLDNGSASSVLEGNAQTRGFLIDADGKPVARVDINERSNRWQLFAYQGDEERMILEQVSEMGLPLQMYGLLDDGRIAAVNQHEGGARDTLLGIDRKSGEMKPVYESGGGDVWAITDPWRHRVVGVSWTDDLPAQKFFDADLDQVARELQQYFSGGYVHIVNWSRDRSRLVLFGERPGDAGAWYVYERSAHKVRGLGKSYPALSTAESLGDRRAIKYPARDGTAIPAYLTLPAGVEPKKLPLVLLVHGGPHARDDFTFNWWASFLASRGYAVLQPNYRGSTGYGYAWFDAGRGRWGDGLMQTDVEDGVDALAKAGTIDAARVCIMGGSYGGYAALAGATVTPDRYACAVSVNGVSDPERMLNDARSGQWGKRGTLAEWWGKSMGSDTKQLHRVSPLAQAAAARIPILIMHGTDDSVVPVEQSRDMQARLQRLDKQVKYVEIEGDDHWLSAASTRTQVLREIETFLAENLRAK
ncbi:MAG TPA: S9 family peptidase [Steroidobacteraceae bacterium]|nr:S9 family peptidase [Steroidobacteraceae bacterium]